MKYGIGQDLNLLKCYKLATEMVMQFGGGLHPGNYHTFNNEIWSIILQHGLQYGLQYSLQSLNIVLSYTDSQYFEFHPFFNIQLVIQIISEITIKCITSFKFSFISDEH